MTNKMTKEKKTEKLSSIKEALLILEHHQKWRRGADIDMIEPKELGRAIDVAIEVLSLDHRPAEEE